MGRSMHGHDADLVANVDAAAQLLADMPEVAGGDDHAPLPARRGGARVRGGRRPEGGGDQGRARAQSAARNRSSTGRSMCASARRQVRRSNATATSPPAVIRTVRTPNASEETPMSMAPRGKLVPKVMSQRLVIRGGCGHRTATGSQCCRWTPRSRTRHSSTMNTTPTATEDVRPSPTIVNTRQPRVRRRGAGSEPPGGRWSR